MTIKITTGHLKKTIKTKELADEAITLLKELVDLEYLSEYAIQDGKDKQAKELIALLEGQK